MTSRGSVPLSALLATGRWEKISHGMPGWQRVGLGRVLRKRPGPIMPHSHEAYLATGTTAGTQPQLYMNMRYY